MDRIDAERGRGIAVRLRVVDEDHGRRVAVHAERVQRVSEGLGRGLTQPRLTRDKGPLEELGELELLIDDPPPAWAPHQRP